MKFIASSATLLKKLNLLNGVVSSSAVIPILEYFLFEVENGSLTISSTDLETSMRTSIPVESKEEGRVAVPAKLIIDFLKSLPEQPITFTINLDTNLVELKTDKGQYKISGDNPDDFPKLPHLENPLRLDIGANALQTAIVSSIFAVSTNELRPAMTGVLFEIMGGEARWVATDGNKLVCYARKDLDVEQESSFIVPKKALNILKSILPNEDIAIAVHYNDSNVKFSFQEFTLVCRLIDERFPDWKAAVPKETPHHLKINRNELLSSLKRMANFSNKSTYQVKFGLSGNELNINAQDIDFSNEAHERLSCEYDGQQMEIGFNARFLIEMLTVADTENIILKLNTYNNPGLIVPDEDNSLDNLLMLLMPIVVQSQE